MNNKGEMKLRSVIFLILIFTGIIAFASIAVNDLADTYSNTNMSSTYNQDSIGADQLEETASGWEDIMESISDGNIFEKVVGTISAIAFVLTEIISAPATFGSILDTVLTDMGVPSSLASIFGFIVALGLYVLIIFEIVSLFMQSGGKV